MSQNYLAIALAERTQRINAWLVVKYDALPWILSAGFSLAIFAGIGAILHSMNTGLSSADATANLYTWARPLYYALVLLACMLSLRSLSTWTWLLTIVVILFFLPQHAINFAVAFWPNSILQPIVAMLGFLALGRVVEYLHLRYVTKLIEPSLTIPAFVVYAGIIFISLVLLLPSIYNLF